MSAETSPRQVWGGDTSCRPPGLCATGCSGLCALLACTGHTGWMGAPPQHSHQSWLCRAQPHSQGAGTVLAGSLTHTHTKTHMYHLPSNKASQQDGIFPKKGNPPFPHQINRNTPVFHDAEESPDSSQNAWNKGWWQMSWGRSRYHRGWREQRGKVCA